MRLGGPVGEYRDFEEWADLHAAKGYGAAYCPISADADAKTIDALRNAAQKHNLLISEVGAWCNPFDRADGEKNMRYIIAQLRLADRVGARCCVNISGSRSDTWDGPHPDNLTRETFDMVVAATRRILDEARPENACFALEPMPWMFPCDVQTMRALLDSVDRERFAVHVDMCNMVNSYEKSLHTGALTREFFAAFRDKIRSVHLKDTFVTPGHLTMHIDEAIPGRGVFDHAALLTECAALGDVPVMLEHLHGMAEYDEAAAHVRRVAERLGLSFESAR